MVLFKCKMCGGELEADTSSKICTCQSCGSTMTLPRLDSDKRINLYDRANHFRRNNDYDKAQGIYESILNDDPSDAEAYWSIVLCKFGVEYVEDPKTLKRIATCNRAQYTSILADEDYKAALEYADPSVKTMYETEAKEIDEIQKGFLKLSAKEKPFDVFICYKEQDGYGRRTEDSVLAQELYYLLEQEGLHVFFSRITLEDKLGEAFEPYIFGALNSAKVMVAVGTNSQNFNAPWVKNEWNRYLALMKNSGEKYLIPAYRTMDAYDLPNELLHLQAVDLGKIGAIQDLVRGIRKLVPPSTKKEEVTVSAHANELTRSMDSMLERAFMCIEDGDFKTADRILDQVLNIYPSSFRAHLGMLLIKAECRKMEGLRESNRSLESYAEYKRTIQFSDPQTRQNLLMIAKDVNERLEERGNEAVRRKEEEARRKEEEVRCKEEEARRKEEETRLKEEEARLKEQASQRNRIILILGSVTIAAILLFFVSKPKMATTDVSFLDNVIAMLPVAIVSFTGAFCRNYSDGMTYLADAACTICSLGTVAMNVIWYKTGYFSTALGCIIIGLVMMIPYFIAIKLGE